MHSQPASFSLRFRTDQCLFVQIYFVFGNSNNVEALLRQFCTRRSLAFRLGAKSYLSPILLVLYFAYCSGVYSHTHTHTHTHTQRNTIQHNTHTHTAGTHTTHTRAHQCFSHCNFMLIFSRYFYHLSYFAQWTFSSFRIWNAQYRCVSRVFYIHSALPYPDLR